MASLIGCNEQIKRVFDLVKDFGTSESPKSTRSSTTHWCPGRPSHPAFRHNIASSLRPHTGLPYDWTPRSDAPLGSPLAPSARRVSPACRRRQRGHIKSALAGSQGCFQRPVVPIRTRRPVKVGKEIPCNVSGLCPDPLPAMESDRRAEGAKGDSKGASERGVQSYGRPVCSRNELAIRTSGAPMSCRRSSRFYFGGSDVPKYFTRSKTHFVAASLQEGIHGVSLQCLPMT